MFMIQEMEEVKRHYRRCKFQTPNGTVVLFKSHLHVFGAKERKTIKNEENL